LGSQCWAGFFSFFSHTAEKCVLNGEFPHLSAAACHVFGEHASPNLRLCLDFLNLLSSLFTQLQDLGLLLFQPASALTYAGLFLWFSSPGKVFSLCPWFSPYSIQFLALPWHGSFLGLKASFIHLSVFSAWSMVEY
jgi:hypothetical protein